MMRSVTGSPVAPPIGLRLARTAHTVAQAFEHAMAEAGGSVSTWQVLLLVRAQTWDTQSKLAGELGITGATLTHHLNALERRGLVRRWRDTSNRRVQRVELTDDGIELFNRLRQVARRQDKRLRSQLSEDETRLLADLLGRLQAGLQAPQRGRPTRRPRSQ
jgi:MarR family transcriptional regulator, transcriptional regulator for hemolysin